MTPIPQAFAGALAGDAVAMPVHWYYNREALVRDYGKVIGYQAPRGDHPDSILWRSSYVPLNERGNILHDQARFWGQRGIHYHQFLRAGENTLNYQLATELYLQVRRVEKYDPDAWLALYVDFMLTPGRHCDTYVEEYHREFFTHYAQGKKSRSCGVDDVHIGGLVPVPALFDALAADEPELLAIVEEHVGLTHRDPGVLRAARAFALILGDLRKGVPLRNAILDRASDWISKAKVAKWSIEPDSVVIGQRLSPACYITDAFPAALYLAWKYADDFSAGICANAQVGGDSCHRAAVVGALLGQANGIPENWLDGLAADGFKVAASEISKT